MLTAPLGRLPSVRKGEGAAIEQQLKLSNWTETFAGQTNKVDMAPENAAAKQWGTHCWSRRSGTHGEKEREREESEGKASVSLRASAAESRLTLSSRVISPRDGSQRDRERGNRRNHLSPACCAAESRRSADLNLSTADRSLAFKSSVKEPPA